MAPPDRSTPEAALLPFGLSSRQAQVLARARCYQENILRGRYVRHPGWSTEWSAREHPPYTDADHGPSVCDVLGYEKPVATPCADLNRYPFDPPLADTTVLRGIARAEVAARRPALQQAVFGWTTPDPHDRRARQAFEAAKTVYWEQCTRSNRLHLDTLKDTADFHANDLLRALYLYGETPGHLRGSDAAWRAPGAFGRDGNFSAAVEGKITDCLLAFKYWIDAPFAVNDPQRPGDKQRIRAARKAWADYPDADLDIEMTYWSENHQLLFASNEYLAGQWLPDAVFRAGNPYRSEGPDRTRPGDLAGRQHMAKARKRLLRWLDERLRFGFSEWNAPGYYNEDLSPLFNLADFCLDEQLRTRAHMVLDLIVFDFARFTLHGSFGVAAGRVYLEHKDCGYGQSVGDLIEVLFGTRDGVIVDGNCGCAIHFSASRRYVVPDALIEIGCDPLPKVVDRSRVSLSFAEAPLYGIGFEDDDDVMFWWGHGAWFVKQLIEQTHKLAAKAHLTDTPPFSKILPPLDQGAAAFNVGESLAYAAAGIVSPTLAAALLPVFGNPFSDKEPAVANAASVLTEGSALTRANLYTYRDRHAMLASAQDFRAGQLSFQNQTVIATLGLQAVVWTGHPSAGTFLSKALLETGGAIAGGVAGAAAGAGTAALAGAALDATMAGATVGAALGPVGMLVGGIAGAIVGKIVGDTAAGDDPEGVAVFPPAHDGPSWWTGTVTAPRVVQRENAAIAIYRPQDIQKLMFGARTHAWFPKAAFDAGSVLQRDANDNVNGVWTFGRCGDGYVALYSAKRPAWTTGGPWADKELRIEGSGNVFIYQVGSVEQFGGYGAFVDAVCRARIHVDGLDECSYDIPDGKRLELHYGDQVRYGGRAFSDDRFPRFQNPYVGSGWVGWTQYHYTIAHNGATLTHDFRELKTVADNPRVHRHVQGPVRKDNDHFLVIAHHGSPRTSVENTLQSCHHAVQNEGANALEIDLCLTRDRHVVLWHDWDPDDVVALVRQLGEQGSNRFRPAVPDRGSPWRKPVNQLTLDELRAHFGYAAIARHHYADEIGPVNATIPTLMEFMRAAVHWGHLEHLFLDVKMPDADADEAGALMDRISAALAVPHAFAVTALVPGEAVLVGMKQRARQVRAPLAFSRDRELPPGIALQSLPLPPAIAATLHEHSAIESAIRHRNAVASVGRPTAATLRPWHVYQALIAQDVRRWQQFNLDPKENRGHQIDKLIAWTINDRDEMDWLLLQGVSGVITDDVAMLRHAASAAQLPFGQRGLQT